MNTKFDFIYLGQGIENPDRSLECYIWFKEQIKEEDKEKILEGIPIPLSEIINWYDNILEFGADDDLGMLIRENYNEEIKSILTSNDEELINKFYEEADTKYGNPDEPTKKELKAFYEDLDKWLTNVNSDFPINLMVKYDFPEKQTDWHIWSVEQVIPKVFPFFDDYIKSGKSSDDEYYEVNRILSWILYLVIEHYIENHPITDLPDEIKNKIIYLIDIFSGYSNYTDEFHIKIMQNVFKSLPKGKDIEKLASLSPNTILNFLSETDKFKSYLKKLSKNNILEYFQDLIPKANIRKTANYIFEICKSIAHVDIKQRASEYELIEYKDSNPILGAQIAELIFDYPDCIDKLFILAGTIYAGLKNWDKAIEVYEKAFERNQKNAKHVTSILFAAIHANKNDIIDKYIDIAMKTPEIINDSHTLANILCVLNTKETEETSELAIKLTSSYWKNPDKQMVPSLYVNMTAAYLTVDRLDPILDEIIVSASSEIEKYFNMYGPLILENIACYYALKNDKENVMHALRLAKAKGHNNFASLEDARHFNKYKPDEDFVALFK